MQYYPAELIKVYRNFKALDPADPLAIVRYYERHEDRFSSLDPEQSFDCLATYTDALFNAEMFRKHLVMADYLLEVIIMENFTTYHGEDIYQHTLLRKACSLIHMADKEKARDVLEQIIRINPENKAARHVLATLLLREQPVWYLKLTHIYTALIILSSICCVVSAFLHFAQFPYSRLVFYFGLFLLGAALVAMIGSRAYHTWKAFAYPRHLARKLLFIKNKHKPIPLKGMK